MAQPEGTPWLTPGRGSHREGTPSSPGIFPLPWPCSSSPRLREHQDLPPSSLGHHQPLVLPAGKATLGFDISLGRRLFSPAPGPAAKFSSRASRRSWRSRDHHLTAGLGHKRSEPQNSPAHGESLTLSGFTHNPMPSGVPAPVSRPQRPPRLQRMSAPCTPAVPGQAKGLLSASCCCRLSDPSNILQLAPGADFCHCSFPREAPALHPQPLSST